MAIFGSKQKPSSHNAALLDNAKRAFATRGNPLDSGVISRAFSAESLDATEREKLDGAVQDLETTLSEVVNETEKSENVEFNENQRDAALAAVAAAGSRQRVQQQAAQIPALGENDRLIPVNAAVSGEASVPRIAQEAFDTTENRNAMLFSFAYNLNAARQDEFGETFFPTITMAPTDAAAIIEVDLLNVLEDQKRQIDGSYQYQFGRKSLVAAMVYPEILHNDTTRMYPVYRDTSPENMANFVQASDVAPYNVETEDGHVIKTAPLAVGRDLDYMGLCAADHLIGMDTLNQTDAIDPAVNLSNVFIKLKTGEVIAFRGLEALAESTYTAAVTGNNRQMNLNYQARRLTVTPTTTKADGTALTLASQTAGHSVSLQFNISSNLNLETGQLNFMAGKVKVEAVFDSSKNKLDIKSAGAGKTSADLFVDAEVIGVDIIARRVNTNRRERGQLLDMNRERMAYALPILSPITAVRPAMDSYEDEDSVKLDRLVKTTYVRCSQAAVKTLKAAEGFLSQIDSQNLEPEMLYNNVALGVGRYYVNPWFKHVDLDVQAEMNTLESANRMADVNAVLVNTIREMAYRAYMESNYMAAASVLQGEIGRKPLIIIGTDQYIAAYLMVTGDLRTLGNEFDVKVVSSPNIEMRNKIYITFGKNGGSNDQINPLHFGNMFWRPELTTNMQISRGQTTTRELTVQPSFRHVVHLPILASITVSNLKGAATKMVPILQKIVP